MHSNLLLVLCFLIGTASFTYSAEPTLGAIRWDAWTGSGNSIGAQVEQTLSPSQYHYRVPFFGIETGANSVTIDGTTQAIMDQEIDYATYAGLAYWAFLWYPASSGLDEALSLYKTSSKKSLIDYCLIVEHERFIAQVSIQQIIDEFKNPSYVKVLNGRPLLYIMGYSTLQVKDIDSLKARSLAQGAGNPYIVQLRVDGSLDVIENLHMDAFSMYAVSWVGSGATYQELMTTEKSQWDWIGINNSKKLVPHITAGWDKRTRHDHPVNWEADPGANAWVQMPTATQLANYVQDAVNWVKSHPSAAEANTVLIYAWNEHDEGGWLSPTLDNYGGTERIDALHSLFGSSVPTLHSPPELSVKQAQSPWKITTLTGKVVEQGYGKQTSHPQLSAGIYWYLSGSLKQKIVIP